MLKQDVPLRTGWFGYRKLDVENCIAHIRAAYAAELRLARQTQQGMEETMAQLRQENKALRQRFAQQAAAQAAASVRAEGSDKLQQLTRKLEAAHAEIRRYQTRLFACERQMIALRRENADLEAACEQAREELQMAVARAERQSSRLPRRLPVRKCRCRPRRRNRPKKLWPAVQDRPHSLRRSRNPCGSRKRSWRSSRWSCCAGLMK